MKKILLIIVICIHYYELSGQDLIILRKGDSLNVTITKSLPDMLEFTFPAENSITILNKEKVHKIIYGSGRVEICNDKRTLPIILGKNDWEKVIITFDENEIEGLIECETIIGTSNYGSLASVQGGEIAIIKMKKKAATIGASIILITDGWHKEKNKPISGYGRGVKLTGKAYK